MGFLFHFDFDAQSSLPFSLYKNRKLHYANNEIIFSLAGSYVSDLLRKRDSFWTGIMEGMGRGREGKGTGLEGELHGHRHHVYSLLSLSG